MPPQETKLNPNITVDTTPQQLADFATKFKALTTTPTYPMAINSSVMSSTPVKIPDTTYQPTTGNLSTAVNTTQANATATGSAAPLTDEKSQLNTYLKGIIDNTGKQADAVAQIQQDENRAKKKERALQLENEITAMDKAYRDEVTAIKENPQGKLASGVQDEVNRATDRYQNNRANASIAYNTALGAYNVANDIVNQKVQALKDQNTQAMNAYSLLKDSIYNDLTESEKLQIQANLNKQKSQADLIESAYTSALSSAAKNGAPASVLSAIDTASKAPNATAASIYAAAGDYLADSSSATVVDTSGRIIPTRAEAQKLNKELTGTDTYKAIIKGQDSLQFLKSFEDLFNETGATSGVFSPRKNAELKAKYNAAILNLKEFFNLGVLNGPDEAILRSVLPDPTNRSAFATTASLGIYKPSANTKAGIDNMKAMIDASLDTRYKTLVNQYGDYSADSVSSLADLQRIYIEQKAKINPEVKKMVEDNPDLTTDDLVSIILK